MGKKLLLIVVCYISLCNWYCYAENNNTLNLSIDDLFSLIDSNNIDVKVARKAVSVAKQGESVARAARLPEIEASIGLDFLGDATILDRDFSNVTNADMPHFGNSLSVTAYQPVYTGGAINNSIKLAKAQTAMANIEFDKTLSGTRMEVISCYLNLYKNYNLQKVYDENISLTKLLIADMEAKKRQGIVLQNDITRYELRLSTLNYDLIAIQNNIKVLNYNLTTRLGIDPSTTIIPDSSIINQDLPIGDISDWQTIAKDNSFATRQVKTEKDIALFNDKIVRSARLPHIGIVAGNIFDGPITIEVPPINKNLNYWWIGIDISYNISSLFKSNKEIKKSALNIAQISARYDAITENVDRQIEQAYTSFTQAFELLKTQEKNVELATENYRIVEKRFDNQLALLTDMLDASSAKLEADVRLVNAQISTIFYYYQLKFISGTL